MIEELNKITKVYEQEKINNTFKLNSICFAMIKPNTIEELTSALKVIKKHKYKFIVLGNASNVILPEFYNGVVISLSNFNKYEIKEDTVYAEAGVMLNKLATMLVNEGYSGLDFACGVPGTIGGSVYGNAGCFGSSISECLISACIFDGKKVIELTNEELKFNYRYSILKDHKKYIVLSAKFKITKSNKEELKNTLKERTEKRMASQDLTHPSNGSIFRNPEGFAAGKLIDDLGLKGYCVNDAMVSYKHANFIINNKNATQEDIIKLIKKLQKEVKKAYGIDLVLEQEIIK